MQPLVKYQNSSRISYVRESKSKPSQFCLHSCLAFLSSRLGLVTIFSQVLLAAIHIYTQ